MFILMAAISLCSSSALLTPPANFESQSQSPRSGGIKKQILLAEYSMMTPEQTKSCMELLARPPWLYFIASLDLPEVI